MAPLGFSDPSPGYAPCGGDIISKFRISAGRADFGADPHLFGAPRSSGRVCWSTGGAGASGAILDGQLYYDDLSNAGCAHITVRFETLAGQLVSLYSDGICGTGGLRQRSAFSQVNGAVRRIRIRLFTSETSAGEKTLVAARILEI